MVTSNQVIRSQILYRGIYIQHINHHAKFEVSSLSSLANTRGGGLKGIPWYCKGENSLGGIVLELNICYGLTSWVMGWEMSGLQTLSFTLKWLSFAHHCFVKILVIYFCHNRNKIYTVFQFLELRNFQQLQQRDFVTELHRNEVI